LKAPPSPLDSPISRVDGITIASTRWNEAYTLFQVSRQIFGVDAHPFLELLGQLTLPGFVHLKAADGSQIIGLAIGEKGRLKDAVWVSALGVLSSYRRRGIGGALLAACEDALDYPCVRLCVRLSNRPAITLYENSGYTRVKVMPRYYLDGEDAYMMEKRRFLDDSPQPRYI
jgi:ribosomal protein S18 acetylase RimI-like enzyme